MNRGGSFQSSLVQQIIMEGGGHSWWNMNNLSSSPSSTSSSSILPDQYPQASNLLPWHENQDLPDSWSQLLLGGFVGEEERCSFTPLQAKQIENMEYQFVYPLLSLPISEVKHENSEGGYGEMLEARSWSKTPPASSTRSCITNSLSSNMLDFSNNKAERRSHQPDHSSESNSTAAAGSTFKKARVQGSSAQSTCKVRKEKLGDRITALHQIVSPFGKTDTASVLLEAIGYIRFLQNQIEALSSPYLGCGSGSIRQPAQGERSCIFPDDPGQLLNDPNSMKKKGLPNQDANDGAKRDLRSRGLCLVPVSCTTMHVSSDLNSADYWAPTLGGGFL